MSISKYFTREWREVKKPEDFLLGCGYVIQFFESETVHIPGDERSRKNPGHGYPAENRTYTTTRQYITTDRRLWQSVITAMVTMGERGFVAYQFERPSVVTKVSVQIGDRGGDDFADVAGGG